MYSQRFNGSIEERLEEPYRFGKYLMQPSLPMLKSSVSKSGSEETREQFITIDDLIKKARDLLAGLSRLGEYRHPLEVRKAAVIKDRKGVDEMSGEGESKTVKAGSRTYFFDIKKTREDKPYLVITESRFKGEGKGHERSSIMVFPEEAQQFLEAVQELVGKL